MMNTENAKVKCRRRSWRPRTYAAWAAAQRSIANSPLLLALIACGTAHADFAVLHNFDAAAGGRAPNGVSTHIGSLLVGVTEQGGTGGGGTAWAYETTTQTFTNLHNFAPITHGAVPFDLATNNNALYGVTATGGANQDGTIWQLFPGPFDNRHDLDRAADGASARSVVLRNNQLYGVAYTGGAGDAGTIWSMNTATGSYDVLRSLDAAADGSHAVGRPVFGGDTLFGTATGGGANDNGTLWSLDTQTNTFAKLHDFAFASDGDSPISDLLRSGDTLYGTALDGGANGAGTLWSYNTTTGVFSNLYDFNGAVDGHAPGGVVRYGDLLLGIAANGGAFGYGTVWSYNLTMDHMNTLHNFNGVTDGSFPTGHLVLDGNRLYGSALFGGPDGGGTLWSFTVPEPTTSALLIVGAAGVLRRRRAGA